MGEASERAFEGVLRELRSHDFQFDHAIVVVVDSKTMKVNGMAFNVSGGKYAEPDETHLLTRSALVAILEQTPRTISYKQDGVEKLN